MPRSESINFKACFDAAVHGIAPRGPFKLPEYQRDFVWGSEKIITLWEDMFQHALEHNQMPDDHPFFLGVIVTQGQGPINLVDGQQRFTALTIIASAIRDSLIACEKIDRAWKIDNELLNQYDLNHGILTRVSRFSPLDNPPGDPLSSERKLKPYRKRILDIDTGLQTRSLGRVGDTTLDTLGMCNWTAMSGATVVVEDVGGISKEYQLQAHINSGNSPPNIALVPALVTEVGVGSKISLKKEVNWPESNVNDPRSSDVYDDDLREAYIRIRTDVEHYILQEKIFSNPYLISHDPLEPTKPKSTHVKPDDSITLNQRLVSVGGEIKKGDTVDYVDPLGHTHNFTLTTDIKSGKDRVKFSGYSTGGSVIPANSNVKFPYGGICAGIPHLSTPRFRARNFRFLITNVEFSRVDFGNRSSDALNFFTRTNDSARMASLTIFDLMSAFTQELVGEHPPAGSDRENIKTEWEKIKTTIYTNLGNDVDAAVDFFYQWMMASKRWDGNKRWEKRDLWTGLETEFRLKYFDKYALWNHAGMLNDYKEMERYSKIYVNAEYPANIVAAAPRRNERVFLQILKQANYKQHLPTYMAIRDQFNRHDPAHRDEVVSKHLKSWIYVYLRYNVFPTKCRNKKYTTAAYTSGQVHSKIVGEGKWIDKIHKFVTSARLPSARQRGEIEKLPRELAGDPNPSYPWARNRPEYKDMDGNRTLLYAHERALHGGGNPTCPELFTDIQEEHVLPQSPAKWGTRWHDGSKPTKLHKNCIERLGNKVLLEDSINSHCKDLEFVEKVVGGEVACPNPHSHIQNSSLKTALQIKDLHDADIFAGKTPNWTKGKMKDRSKEVMNDIVGFFN